MAHFEETVSHKVILTWFEKYREDPIKIRQRFLHTKQVVISDTEVLSEYDLWCILYCITKMRIVKEVEVTPDREWMENPFKLLEVDGFVKETCKETEGSSAKVTRARWIKTEPKPKATLPGEEPYDRLIIPLSKMTDMLRKSAPANAKSTKDINIFLIDTPLIYQDFSKFLSYYSHIQALRLSGKSTLGNSDLRIISENLHQLQALYIYMKGDISDEGICFLTGEDDASEAPCPSLRLLAIYKRQNITKRSLLRMKNKLPNLEYLDLPVNDLDAEALDYTATMPSLEMVTFSYHDRINVTPALDSSVKRMEEAGFTVSGINGKLKVDCGNHYQMFFMKPSTSTE